MAATVSLDSARVELLAGDPVAAERELRRDYDVLESIGERYALSTLAGLLGYALVRQGRLDAAIAATEAAEQMAAADDVESQSLWRRVRAAAVTALGAPEEALPLALAAYDLVVDTDAPLMKAFALLDLGEVHAAAGSVEEAQRAWQDALALFDAKEASVPAAMARDLLDLYALPSRNESRDA